MGARRGTEFLTPANAARALGVSRQRLHTLIKQGQLGTTEVAGLGKVISSKDLQRFRRQRQLGTRQTNQRRRPLQSASKGQPPVVSTPATPTSATLPLNDPNLSWEQFEAFAEALVSQFQDVKEVHRYGGRGSRQRGIDIFADFKDGRRWAFQVRQWRKFGRSHVQRAIRETTYKADRFVLFLSSQASSVAREACEGEWDLWDVRDISRKVKHELPLEAAARLVEAHFGPQWRRAFLGVSALTAFVTPKEHFGRLLDPGRLFNHAWSLVGRAELLKGLSDFIDSRLWRVVILAGRGGIGKTKILQAFSEDFAKKPGYVLRFVVEGVPISAESADHLPIQPLVLVADDAHRLDDLPILLRLGQHRQNLYPVKLILSTRPQGLERVRSLLTEYGFDPREIVELPEVKELSREQVRDLACQALGPKFAHLADQLAAITHDNPLVTVVGGQLLAERAVDPNLLEREEEFRNVVMTRFRDVLIGQVSDVLGSEFCRNLLDLIAALAPIRPTNEEFQARAAAFLGTDKDTLVRALSTLEQSGVLLRRGHTLRITPDVLADHLLHQACLTVQGQPTGYAERVFDTFSSVWPGQILRNLAELDWRVYRTTGDSNNLLEEIWGLLETEFRSAPNSGRCHILDLLEELAHFQPKRVMALIEFAIRTPAQATEDERLVRLYAYSHADVLRRLPKLLQRVGYNLDYLPRCCDLLWELGRDDHRDTNPNPEHPMRVLTDLAGYDIGKPLVFNEATLDAASRWLAQPDVHDYFHSPLDLVDPLLAKNALSTYSEGYKFVLRPFMVNHETTKTIRARALDLIMASASSGKPRALFRALGSLEEALRDPLGLLGQEISDEERGKWIPDQLEALDRIAEVAKASDSPIAHLRILEIVRWHADHSSSHPIRRKAQAIIELIANRFELRLARVLGDSYAWNRILPQEPDEELDYRKREERITEMRQETAEDFVRRYTDPLNGFDVLCQYLGKIVESGREPNPSRFFYDLSSSQPAYAAQLCESIVRSPDTLLAPFFSSLLHGVRESRPSDSTELVRRGLATGQILLARSVADGLRVWLENPLDDDIQIVRDLVGHGDAGVKALATTALVSLKRSYPRIAIDIAVSMDVGDDPNLAKHLYEIFDDKWGVPPESLTDDDWALLIGKLERIARIDDYRISEFLADAARRKPEAVVELLLKRIDLDGYAVGKDYQPLPHLQFHHKLDGIAGGKSFKRLLEQVRNRMLAAGWRKRYWIPKLYNIISQGYGPESLRVLQEWIGSRDAAKIEGASLLLRDADRSFVFANVEFVATLLEKAYDLGDECYREVGSNLFASAIAGVRSGTPGGPMPQDVALKDQADAEVSKFGAGSPVHRFYESLSRYAAKLIRDQLAEDEELLD